MGGPRLCPQIAPQIALDRQRLNRREKKIRFPSPRLGFQVAELPI